MAIELQKYNAEIQRLTFKKYVKKIALFNQASGNALVMVQEGFKGAFKSSSFFNEIRNAQRRVDLNAAEGAVADTNLTTGEHVSVKLVGAFGPIRIKSQDLKLFGLDPVAAIRAIAEQFSDIILKDQLYTALEGSIAAIGEWTGNLGEMNLVNDIKATASVSQEALNDTYALMGDSSSSLITSFMSGLMFHRLVGQAITNDQRLFTSSDIQVVSIQGKMIVVADAPALTGAAGAVSQNILTLVANGVTVSEAEVTEFNISKTNGTTLVKTTAQGDYQFTLDIKNFSWDKSAGGETPTQAKIGTGANWTADLADAKSCAGVLTIVKTAK